MIGAGARAAAHRPRSPTELPVFGRTPDSQTAQCTWSGAGCARRKRPVNEKNRPTPVTCSLCDVELGRVPSNRLIQCFGHSGLPPRAGRLPLRQSVRRQANRDRCPRGPRLRTTTWLQQSLCGGRSKQFRQNFAGRLRFRERSLLPLGVLDDLLCFSGLALHRV